MKVLQRHTIAFIVTSVFLPTYICTIGFAKNSPRYHLLRRVILGRDGAWDYFDVDQNSHQIVIPRGAHTMFVEPDGKVMADVRKMQGAHGVAFVPALHRAFISDGPAHSVSVVDEKTMALMKDIALPGLNSDAIIYDEFSDRIFTFNGRWDGATNTWTRTSYTAIDPYTGEVINTLPLPGKPEAAQADKSGGIFVNIINKNEIVEFETKTFKILHKWSLSPCVSPTGLSIDIRHNRLFAGCRNQIVVAIDDKSGDVVGMFPIGRGVDSLRFDPSTGLIFSSNGEGSITVAHEDSPNRYSVVQTIATQPGTRTMAIDLASHRIYTITAKFGPAPAPTAERPRPGPTPQAGTVTLLVYAN